MVTRRYSLFGSLLLLGILCYGQQPDTFIFETPELLDPRINSEAEEVIPLISPDGTVLYFSRYQHPQNKGGKEAGLDIWYSLKSDEEWTDAKNFSVLNSETSDAVIGFGESGKDLYLMNNGDKAGIAHTSISNENKRAPIQYDRIRLPVSARDIYGLYVNNHLDLALLAINHDSLDVGYEIHFYRKRGKGWFPMRTKGINSKHHEFSPFLTNDSTLFFASNRPGGQGGFDLYYSRPLSKNLFKWSEPKNLGSTINSEKYDAYLSVSDGGEVFFVSNRDSELSDIYHSRVVLPKSKKKVVSEVDTLPTMVAATTEVKSDEILDAIETKGRAAPEYVYFGFNAVTIEDSSSTILQIVANILKENNYVGIELQGYADSIGSAAYNIELSKKRSESVRDFLIAQNVPPAQIRTVAFGEGTPIATNTSAKGRAMNRRVRLLLLKK